MVEEAFNKSSFSFTLKLYKEVSHEFASRDSYVYSPLSIQSCLTMVYMGAEGATADSIANVLEYNQTLNKVDIACLVKYVMEQGEEDDSIEVANTILVDKDWKISKFYQNLMRNFFHSSIETLNHNPDGNLSTAINEWVSRSTYGRITEIDQELVNEDKNSRKKLLLLDAIYFKGRWAYEFDKALTKPRKFWVSKEEFVRVETMEITNFFNYCRFDEHNFSVLEMNYVESELSFLILLPDEPNLCKIEEEADKLKMYDVVTRLYLKAVQVFLPKFTLDFTVDLKDTFCRLGIGSLFDANEANMNGIFEKGCGEKKCFDSVIHKAVIAVDEEGAVVHDAEIGEVEVVFDVNKPFFFFLKHKWEHNIVYSGCVKKF